jgi:hypothetical protein
MINQAQKESSHIHMKKGNNLVTAQGYILLGRFPYTNIYIFYYTGR